MLMTGAEHCACKQCRECTQQDGKCQTSKRTPNKKKIILKKIYVERSKCWMDPMIS